jgi:glycosyltransferase involved in cell wall biosynthesis
MGIKQKQTKPYFLSIGTIEPRKNLDFYAQAVKKSGLHSSFDFLHIGRQGWGMLPDQLKIVETHSDQDLANLITNATAVVIPSLYEGFGLPVLESHTQGIPIVMSNVDSLVELSNQNDKIFELNNIDSLVDSLNHFAQNNIRLSSLEIDLAKTYTWQESAKKHAEVYLGLLK